MNAQTHYTVFRVTETAHEDGETWTIDYTEKSEALAAIGRAADNENQASMKKLTYPIPVFRG